MSHIPSSRKKEIEEAVERLILDTGLSYPANNLVEIASALGVRVESADLPNFEGKKVKGLIQWEDLDLEGGGPVRDARILLNSSQSSTVKNFTLAHEIGHFLLHKGEDNLRIDLQEYTREADPKNYETEANYFAGTLLMPKEKLMQAIHNSKNLDEVAEMFKVSRPAVDARLRWLGIVVAD